MECFDIGTTTVVDHSHVNGSEEMRTYFVYFELVSSLLHFSTKTH